MLPPDNKIIYSHDSRVRCGQCFGSNVKSVGTRMDGLIKRWKCSDCQTNFKTVGKKV